MNSPHSVSIIPPPAPCRSDITHSGYVVCEVQASAALACKNVRTHYKPSNLEECVNAARRQSGDAPPYLIPRRRGFYVRKTWKSRLGVGWEGVWHICADWQGGGPERNVPTLKFREAALWTRCLQAPRLKMFVSLGFNNLWYILNFKFSLSSFQSRLVSLLSEHLTSSGQKLDSVVLSLCGQNVVWTKMTDGVTEGCGRPTLGLYGRIKNKIKDLQNHT